MVQIPSPDDLFKANVHFGHRTSRRHPKMEPYIFGVKNTVHIIDLEKTIIKLKEALDFTVEKVAQGGVILFLGTKPSAKETIKKYAEKVEMPYITERWVAGLLTNFSTISHLIRKFQKMLKDKKEGEWEKYSKKEKLDLEKELNKLEKMVGGIRNLEKLPQAIFIVDIQEESTAIREARRAKIPVVAMVDTNTNPDLVDWPIPANDDAIKSIELIAGLVAAAIEEGRAKLKSSADKKGKTEEEIIKNSKSN